MADTTGFLGLQFWFYIGLIYAKGEIKSWIKSRTLYGEVAPVHVGVT
jgi:hypothetical protein